ncbi:MAG: hypothetical protein Q7K57_00355, partial [Burkholderiaceae bacterium]|nr:hypothetical protein [Burkholderiaceae bacterium]
MTISIQKDALLSQFSVLAYKNTQFLSNSANLPSGWELKLANDQSPPFAAFAFKNAATGEVVIAYRGTDGLKDGSADLAILSGSWDPQFQQGMDFVAKVQGDRAIFPLGTNPNTLLVTGHSLGGAIAQIVAKAFGLDGSTIDSGAASRIVQTADFRIAAIAAGLQVEGLGAPATFTNHLVVDSLVSGGTGEHIGRTSYLPSVTFSSQQALYAFLIGAVNPLAGIAYAMGTDQLGNKHSSQQVSQALGLLAGTQADTSSPSTLTLHLKDIGTTTDPVTGQSIPRYSQTEFEVKDSAGALQSTVKFSGAGAERMIEVFDVGGALQSTTTSSATGVITVRPINAPSVVINYLPDAATNRDGTITVTTKDSQDNTLSSGTKQIDDDGNVLEIITNVDGRGAVRAYDNTGRLLNENLFSRSNDAGQPDMDGKHLDIASSVDGRPVAVRAEISGGGVEGDLAENIHIVGITAINGQALFTDTTYAFHPEDFEAFSFTYPKLINGTIDTRGQFLLTGLDPATQAATGQPAPQVVEAPLPQGFSRTLELGGGMTLTSTYNDDRRLLSVSEVTAHNAFESSRKTYTVNADGRQVLTSTSYRSTGLDGTYTGVETDVLARKVYTIAGDVDGNPIRFENIDASANLQNSDAATVFSDLSGLLGALKSGQTLPALASGLRLVNDLNIANGTPAPDLGAASGVAAGALSFYNLYNAMNSGDTFSQVNATLSAINYANIAINASATTGAFVGGSAAAGLNSALNGGAGGLMSGTLGVLPALGLIMSIQNGDPVGIAMSMGTLIQGSAFLLTNPIGWVLIGASILQIAFAPGPPKAWGVANVTYKTTYGPGITDLGLQVNASGDSFGTDRARQGLQGIVNYLQGSVVDSY